MRNLHSIANTGALFHKNTRQFLGSSFIFRYTDTLLTAAHCVEKLNPKDILIKIFSTNNKVYEVIDIERHPKADVAILRVKGINEREIGYPKSSLFDDNIFGLEVVSCGFPEDSQLGFSEPTARVFRGHVQRFVNWKSYLGYDYIGAELSFRCPGGLSGGELFNREHVGRTYGLITENIRTSSILDSIEEIEENGEIYREHHESIIYYGIAVWLPAISDWIDLKIPPISNEESSRRAKLQAELHAIDNNLKK
jgi:hypothetical protein